MVCTDKWLYRITGCLIAGAMFFVSQSVFAVPAVVDYVIDGDTFAAAVKINTDISITVRVRILDVDTPEIHGKCESETYLANRAKDALAKLLPVGTVVDLQNVKDEEHWLLDTSLNEVYWPCSHSRAIPSFPSQLIWGAVFKMVTLTKTLKPK